MQQRTRQMWQKQDQHHEVVGDRRRLFQVVGEHISPERVLYPGSYVDLSPSFVFPNVAYVDIDKRANAFFEDQDGIRELIRESAASPKQPQVAFIHADYTSDLGLADASFDLLVSLYAGFVSEACTDALRIGGTLLVNSSHGDVAMADLDPRYQLAGVIQHRSGAYKISATNLDSYLIPKKPQQLTRSSLHRSGRGVAYSKPAFAYLFTRIG